MSGVLINPTAAAGNDGFLGSGASFGTGALSGLGTLAGTVLSGGNPIVGSLVGSGLSYLGNLFSQRQSVNASKELYDYQTDYGKLFGKMVQAGINPSAAAAGLSGSTPSMQSVSSHPAPDLSSLGTQMVELQRNPSIIAKNESDVLLNKARTAELRQLMTFNPLRWNAEVRKALSEVEVNTSNSWYLNELARSVKAKRPWEIWNLQRGYELLGAQITNQLSQASLFFSQKGYFDQRTKNEKVLTFINRCQASFWRVGLNPFENPFRSLIRLSALNPKAAEGVVGNSLKFLGFMDDRISEVAGKNWKKFAAAGLLYNYHLNASGKRAFRRSNNLRALTGAVGLIGSGLTKSPIPASLAGSAMDNPDWFDYFSYY